MYYKRFDKETNLLIQDCVQQLSVFSPGLPATIRKLRRVARKVSDEWLLAFTYYHEAMYVYYTSSNSSAYRRYMQKAVYHILRADEKYMLSHIYNFIAIDAHNSGCFDIAFNYYMTAMRLATELKDTGARALIDSNLGRLYSEMGDHKRAHKHFRRSIRANKSQKKNFRYLQNTMIMLVSDGIVLLDLGEIEAAAEALAEIEQLLATADEETRMELQLSVAFLQARLALAKGETRTVRSKIKTLAGYLRTEPRIQDYTCDICALCHALIEKKMFVPAGLVIDVADSRIAITGNSYVVRIFCDLKCDYYDAKKDEENLVKSLKEQHELSFRLRSEQQNVYENAVNLIRMVEDLRKEQERIRRENEELRVKFQTDALCGIPNRYGMNDMLNRAYENVFRNKHSLGVTITDVDYFKEYNDTYGHPAGDECLKKIAGILSSLASGYGAYCARYGGDEFVLIYENRDDETLCAIAKEIEERVAALKIEHKGSPSGFVTMSQGICNDVPEARSNPWDFLSVADDALYAVKKRRGDAERPATYCLSKYYPENKDQKEPSPLEPAVTVPPGKRARWH